MSMEAMADLRRKKDPLWWRSATQAEKAAVERIDARMEKLSVLRRELSRQRYSITNRCTVRTIGRREKKT